MGRPSLRTMLPVLQLLARLRGRPICTVYRAALVSNIEQKAHRDQWTVLNPLSTIMTDAMLRQNMEQEAHTTPEVRGLLSSIPSAPKDPMFGLTAAYKADTSSAKVNLGVGAYKHTDGNPWVLPSVRQAKKALYEADHQDHEYLPIAGLQSYLSASARLLLGTGSAALAEGRVASVQTLSGTGALSLGARFLSSYLPDTFNRTVYVSQPPYINHEPIMREARLSTRRYRYYAPQSYSLDFEGMLADLQALPNGSVVLLHACAHNPTAVDPTPAQWEAICKIMLLKRMIPFLDSAYQGFASGDVDQDAFAVRLFSEAAFDAVFIAQSYAKNFGLYGERVGCLHVVAPTKREAQAWLSQLERLQRVSISTPPAYGARIVSLVLNDAKLYEQWQNDLRTMSGRITAMRQALRQRLETSEGSAWQHLTAGVGMFCFTGLNERQVRRLRDRHHIYMTADARINVSGLNGSNVGRVADAFKAVISEGSL